MNLPGVQAKSPVGHFSYGIKDLLELNKASRGQKSKQEGPKSWVTRRPLIVNLKLWTKPLHCIPAEDLLLQRKLKGSWYEDKVYLTLKKYVHNSRRV
jgi:hypothetical protein